MSLPEAMLWNQLRGARLGFKVRRQHPLGPYVVDFYVAVGRLVIEVDGEAHGCTDRRQRDAARDAFLLENEYGLLRVSAVDVLRNIAGVIDAILARAGTPLHHPADGPPPRAEEEL